MFLVVNTHLSELDSLDFFSIGSYEAQGLQDESYVNELYGDHIMNNRMMVYNN